MQGQHLTQQPARASRPSTRTTAYTFKSTEHAANLFGLAETGNIYSRLMNPTNDVVEQRVAALEGGTAGLLVASGQAAETYAVLNLTRSGDHIVSSASIYGGTYNLFAHTLRKLGIEVTFIEDQDNLDEWKAAINPNTKLFFAESIGNPQDQLPEHPRGLSNRPRRGRAADRRQHHCDAVPDPPPRARSRHRRALGDEVPRRARFRARRRHRRRRQVRMVGSPTSSPTSTSPTRATTESSTPRLSATPSPTS